MRDCRIANKTFVNSRDGDVIGKRKLKDASSASVTCPRVFNSSLGLIISPKLSNCPDNKIAFSERSVR